MISKMKTFNNFDIKILILVYEIWKLIAIYTLIIPISHLNLWFEYVCNSFKMIVCTN